MCSAAQLVVAACDHQHTTCVLDGRRAVASDQRQCGAVHLDRARQHPQPAALRTSGGSADHSSMAARRASTRSSSPISIVTPTNPIASTGRWAMISSGMARAQSRNVASRRSRRIAGSASSASRVQCLERRLPVGGARHGVPQGALQSVQHRGTEEEPLDRVRLPFQDLADEVVDDEPIVPCEPGDEFTDVFSALHREGGELQCGDPPSGAHVQRLDVVRRQPEAHRAVRVVRSFVAVKRRSAARISSSWPRARIRASGSGGSARLVITSRVRSERCSRR